ncbi:MAG: transposase [Candidatus Thiodiazotropha sp. (ex Lucinoma aequizonata)]|nr:transposase [Candidatus Thiodiazotropha sp. (ex Lucinoma aequizonata)]MCU7896478.1 transposase [Candidatus Thiodiazotropha sp. (ex Lucinoma aequizonata)]MCU7898201.1 transposase [Candidatus Thiodiazotropha sp. (ex Lucinoma aequizonata)]MCU7903832.1 transposase [Candidatus Thiodiazotropha sp. (ex Lucinoma aequizonata)]MCU7909747.1 transposase [Candidatus Thiodiazotropha sp. (ex Lucinoma aequizonata)]
MIQYTCTSWLSTIDLTEVERIATRRKYSKEFKLDAISLVEEQGYATTEAASSLGIRPELIRRWIRERQADDGQAFRGNRKRTPEQKEIKRLKTKMKRLEMEKEILKKA